MIDPNCLECKKYTGGCGCHSVTYFGENRKPHKCPVCDGTGKVSRPPWVAGDVDTWTDSQTGPYPCQPCDGKGIIWG